jgi:hypothetical protein
MSLVEKEDVHLTGFFLLCCLQPGDFRIEGSNVRRQILGNKLRLLYDRRPCRDVSRALLLKLAALCETIFFSHPMDFY